MRFTAFSSPSLVALAAALSGLGLATPAMAQEQVAEDQDRGIGVIVVTAQKRAEDQRDVPLSISTLSADALA
ncbi:MAG: hypothetical protein ACT6SC_11945, partial [Blastomonas fulva]